MRFSFCQQILDLAPPPNHPKFSGSDSSWQEYQKKWKLVFPVDYVWLVGKYGKGAFYDEVSFATPFAITAYGDRDIITLHQQETKGLSQIECFQTENTWPIWPSHGGMLYCGRDCNGNMYFWKTNGAPDDWTISAFSGGFFEEEHYPFGLVEFVVRWLKGEFDSEIMLTAEFYRGKKGLPVFFPYPGE